MSFVLDPYVLDGIFYQKFKNPHRDCYLNIKKDPNDTKKDILDEIIETYRNIDPIIRKILLYIPTDDPRYFSCVYRYVKSSNMQLSRIHEIMCSINIHALYCALDNEIIPQLTPKAFCGLIWSDFNGVRAYQLCPKYIQISDIPDKMIKNNIMKFKIDDLKYLIEQGLDLNKPEYKGIMLMFLTKSSAVLPTYISQHTNHLFDRSPFKHLPSYFSGTEGVLRRMFDQFEELYLYIGDLSVVANHYVDICLFAYHEK